MTVLKMTDRRRERRSDRELPHQSSSMSRFLKRHIDDMASIKSQRQIADELGYERPQIISMMKNGEIKVPLEKVFPLARALQVDPAHLLRLAIEQLADPAALKDIKTMFGRIATEAEAKLLETWRGTTGGVDPHVDEEIINDFACIVRSRGGALSEKSVSAKAAAETGSDPHFPSDSNAEIMKPDSIEIQGQAAQRHPSITGRGQFPTAENVAGSIAPASARYQDLNFKVDPDLHQRVKIEAAARRMKMVEFFRVMFEDYIQRYPTSKPRS